MVADAVGQCYYQPLSPLSISVTIIASIRCRWFYWVVMVTYLWPPMSFAGYLYYHTTKGGQYRYLVYLSIYWPPSHDWLYGIVCIKLWHIVEPPFEQLSSLVIRTLIQTRVLSYCWLVVSWAINHLNVIFEYVVMISPNTSLLRLNTLITSPIQWIVLEMRVGGNSSMGLDQASNTLRKSCSSCTISHSD